MPNDFCDHLGDYEAQFVKAKAAYGQMLECLEGVMRDGRRDENVELLEDAVEEWEREVGYLRDLFLIYVRRGTIGLPVSRDDDDEGATDPRDPVCTVCGEVVPKLRWTEWEVAGQGAAFRGRPFLTPADPVPSV